MPFSAAWLEGHVPEAPSDPGNAVELALRYADSVAWVAPVEEPSEGATTHRTFYALKSPPAGEFPVLSTTLDIPQERTAFEALLAHGVNPCTASVGKTSVCAAALTEQPSRTPDDVVADLARAIEADLGSEVTLASLQTNASAVRRAARYLVERADVLGQAIYPTRSEELSGGGSTPAPADGENGLSFDRMPRRRYAIRDPRTGPVDPWYLYARTGGADFPIGPWGVPGNMVLTSEHWQRYALVGIYHMIDTFRFRLERGLIDLSGLNQSAQNIVRKTAAWADQLVQGRASVELNADDDERLVGLKVWIQRPFGSGQEASSAQASVPEMFDAWLGEIGLACAHAGGEIPGLDCARYKFGEQNWSASAPSAAVLDLAWVDENDMSNTNMPSVPVAPGMRIYVTTPGPAVVETVLGFTVAPLRPRFSDSTSSGPQSFTVPLSTAMLRDLSGCIGPDPVRPDTATTSCVSLPNRVKLEDELSEAFTGADKIESSFAYYLNLAEKAAERADELGKELIRQGLAIDERAQGARDQLQSACGGVVNVPDWLCDGVDCDLVGDIDALQDRAAETALQACIGETEKVWTVFGNDPVCIWRVSGRNGLGETSPALARPPCTCEGAGCPTACSAIAPTDGCLPGGATPKPGESCCAGGQLQDGTCAEPQWGDSDALCAPLFDTPNDESLRADLEYLLVTHPLRITIPEEPSPDADTASNTTSTLTVQDGCEVFRQLRGSRPDSITESQLKKLRALSESFIAAGAQTYGISREPINIPSLDVLGARWSPIADGYLFRGGQVTVEPSEDRYCAPSSTSASWDAYAPLAQGIDCRASPNAPGVGGPAARIRLARNIGDRLAKAVELLRLISRSGMSGVQVVATRGPINNDTHPNDYDSLRPDQLVFKSYVKWAAPFNWNKLDDYTAPKYGRLPVLSFRGLPLLGKRATHRAGKNCNQTEFDPLGFQGAEMCHEYHKDESASTIRRLMNHGTHYMGSGSRTEGDVYLVCVDAEHPDAEHLASVLDMPTCQRDRHGQKIWFMDAGRLVTWPVLSEDAHRQLWDEGGFLERVQSALVAKDLTAKFPADRPHDLGGRPSAVGWTTMRRTYPALSNFHYGNWLDAIELACDSLSESMDMGATPDLEDIDPEEITTPEQLQPLVRVGKNMALGMRRDLEKTYLADVPIDVARAFDVGGTADVSLAFGGKYAVQAGALQSSLKKLTATVMAVSALVEGDAIALESVRHRIRGMEAQARAHAARATAVVSVAGMRCMASMANALAQDLVNSTGGLSSFAALMGCEAGRIEAKTKEAVFEIKKNVVQDEIRAALLDAARRFRGTRSELKLAFSNIKTAVNDARTAIAELNSVREEARNAAGKVLMLSRDEETGRVYSVNTIMRARYNTLRRRYELALDDARKLAYLARRAIEQRLGVDLASIDEDLSLVEKPRAWVDRLCGMAGIDYRALRSAGGAPTSHPEGYDYFDGFIGDYVRKLRLALESYRVDFPSQDGDDTVVVSLREDIFHPVAYCTEAGPNLLLDSADITSPLVWKQGCFEAQCVNASPVAEAPWPFPASGEPRDVGSRENSEAHPVRLSVLDGEGVEPAEESDSSPQVQGISGHVQALALTPGEYLLSWYERGVVQEDTGACEAPSEPRVRATAWIKGAPDEPTLREVNASPVFAACTGNAMAGTCDPGLNRCWRRFFRRLQVPVQGVRGDVMVAISPVGDTAVVGAPMLERVEPRTSVGPRQFYSTSATDRSRLVPCSDESGDVFRTKYWTYRCEPTCPAGLADVCRASGERTDDELCFFETTFTLPLEEIEGGELLSSAGFSAGNFNYRFRDVALNVVGTRVKSCSEQDRARPCQAGNFLQYSLEQTGPYRVRNFQGSVYEAQLYPGRIQQGKALLAERYLTNPISSIDRGLLSDYFDGELAGRPLDGTFTLRIYKTPGLQWRAVEDVQLVINYRHWTRLR